ncbi:hypothetical protein Cni_G05548 [Canna indica]|uniref:Ribosomal protein L34Ae n=1 Tax=Canna indica TaxID=4628 RepID=A0AAQ3Q3C1_9LILI|nr:hypothetical protein Cni_G05548 [Canna indica]
MPLLVFFCWFCVANSLIFFVGFIARHAFSFRKSVKVIPARDEQKASGAEESSDRSHDSLEEKEEPGFTFRFQYQISNHQEGHNGEEGKSSSISSIQNCVFESEKDFTCFVEEPKARILCLEESRSNDSSSFHSHGEANLVADFDSSSLSDGNCQQPSAEIGQAVEIDNEIMWKEKGLDCETNIMSEEFSGFGSEADSISVSDGYSVHELVVDSDGYLSERDFGEHEEEEETRENSPSTENDELKQFDNATESACLGSKILFLDGRASENKQNNSFGGEAETRSVHEAQKASLPSSNSTHIEFTDSSDDDEYLVDNDYSLRKGNDEVPIGDKTDDQMPKRDSNEQQQNTEGVKKRPDWGVTKSEKTNLKDAGEGEYGELESLWEHQDLIEQLRMELRKMRDIGLPTILEESESPGTVEDLKPLKMDESFLHEDPMNELQKSYRTYRERMRKFDILNYQKMYAIGFLQLDDPHQSVGSKKTLMPSIQSILSQSSWSIRRKSSNHPTDKLIRELQSDLEMVYVGQTCLSWEFLRWQHEKARELPESDPFKNHYYNQVAGEFQQFQVNIQRFIENESFQGPRLLNYIQNRCVLRNLLQVPVIREDYFKDKMEDEQKGITSEVMVDIMEESIRIFWEFVKGDKDESPGILKGFMGTHAELQDPSDFDLMEDIQSDLHKKDKKLKDILKTGKCLVKKFKRPKEDRSNQDLFFSQVDLKLVARVLRMGRITTEQLLWCHKKLSKIKLAERKVYREPSFLLFPC